MCLFVLKIHTATINAKAQTVNLITFFFESCFSLINITDK